MARSERIPEDVLKIAFKSATSIESAGSNANGMEYLGTAETGAPGRVFDYYRDGTGAYWYESMILTQRGKITLEEHIFGRRIPIPHKKK